MYEILKDALYSLHKEGHQYYYYQPVHTYVLNPKVGREEGGRKEMEGEGGKEEERKERREGGGRGTDGGREGGWVGGWVGGGKEGGGRERDE